MAPVINDSINKIIWFDFQVIVFYGLTFMH